MRSGRFELKAYLDRADGKAHKMVLDHGHTAGELVLMVMEMMVAAWLWLSGLAASLYSDSENKLSFVRKCW